MSKLSQKVRDIEFENKSQCSIILSGSHQSRKRQHSRMSHPPQINVSHPSQQSECSYHSVSSSRSNKSNQSVRSTKSSEKIAEAAADVAAIKAGLKFVEAEARQRAELERVTMTKKLEIANARLNTLNKLDSPDIAINNDQSISTPPVSKGLQNPEVTAFLPGKTSDRTPQVSDHTNKSDNNPYTAPLYAPTSSLQELAKQFADQAHLSRIPTQNQVYSTVMFYNILHGGRPLKC